MKNLGQRYVQYINRKIYRDLFKMHIDPNIDDQIRSATNDNNVLADQRFQDQIARMLGRSVTSGKAGRFKLCEVGTS
jgi:hypothetical protein